MELSERERQLKSEQERHRVQPEGLNEHEREQDANYEWVLHDPEVQRTYAGKVVAAHGRKVVGVGKNHGDALEAALRQPECPRRDEIALVYVEGRPIDAW